MNGMYLLDWVYLRSVFMTQLATVLPWLLAGAALSAALYLTPLSRALLRYVRERKRDTGLTEAMLGELRELKLALAEVLERLDSTDQRLRSLR
jgi:hypothetical protein